MYNEYSRPILDKMLSLVCLIDSVTKTNIIAVGTVDIYSAPIPIIFSVLFVYLYSMNVSINNTNDIIYMYNSLFDNTFKCFFTSIPARKHGMPINKKFLRKCCAVIKLSLKKNEYFPKIIFAHINRVATL